MEILDTTILNFQSFKLSVLFTEHTNWYVAHEVLKAIKSTTTVTRLEDIVVTDLGEGHCKKQLIKTRGGLQTCLIISQEGLKYTLQRSRKSDAKLLAQFLELDLNIMQSPIEATTLKIIKYTFQHFQPIEQFFVAGFRIDLYFPEQQLAIECMENFHKYSLLKDQKREEDITKILNCSWVYYYPQDEAFSIGKTLNKIIKYIYEV